MGWDFKSGMPIYTQIAEHIRMDIASGVYKSGDKLQSVRELAIEAATNPNTVQRAFAELEREGLIYTERTNGKFITREESVLEQLKRSLGEKIISDFFDNLNRLGMSNEEIVKSVTDWAKEAIA